jgi:hypothetical protein
MASEEHTQGWPEPAPPVHPTKRWALYVDYPIHRNVTGRLEKAVSFCIHWDDMARYIKWKHCFTEAHLDKVATDIYEHIFAVSQRINERQ